MDKHRHSSLVEGLKLCTVCKETKDVTAFNFYRAKGRKLSRIAICKSCQSKWHRDYHLKNTTAETKAKDAARARQWRRDNPEKAREKSARFHAKYRERDRADVYERYGNRCACCGETRTAFLTMDHVFDDGRDERERALYTNSRQFYALVIKLGYPSDYQLLCYNCNEGRARNGGTCPHHKDEPGAWPLCGKGVYR